MTRMILGTKLKSFQHCHSILHRGAVLRHTCANGPLINSLYIRHNRIGSPTSDNLYSVNVGLQKK